MNRKTSSVISIILALILLFSLVGCGPKTPAEVNILVNVVNETGYIFNELHVSSSGDSNWGDDLLGSTSVLKSGGTYGVTIKKAEFDNYDFFIVDEDGDEYKFNYISLTNGCKVTIYFDNGIALDVYYEDGSSNSYSGLVNGESSNGGGNGGGNSGGSVDGPDPADATVSNDYYFSVVNKSAYDIYAVMMGPAGGSAEEDIDILEDILRSEYYVDVWGTVSDSEAGIDEWTLYIIDVDGDTSASYETFNPWELSYVDIYWDSNAGGYTCDFHY